LALAPTPSWCSSEVGPCPMKPKRWRFAQDSHVNNGGWQRTSTPSLPKQWRSHGANATLGFGDQRRKDDERLAQWCPQVTNRRQHLIYNCRLLTKQPSRSERRHGESSLTPVLQDSPLKREESKAGTEPPLRQSSHTADLKNAWKEAGCAVVLSPASEWSGAVHNDRRSAASP
jgi:hypothetical protein